MKLFLITLLGWAMCGVVLLIFALNLWVLWWLWLVALGVLVGKVLSLKPRLPEIAGATIALFIVGTIGFRALPVHSLGWDWCSQMKITKLGETWEVEISDPAEIEAFKSYGRRGHYETGRSLAPATTFTQEMDRA